MFEKLSLINVGLNNAQEQKFISFIDLFKDYNSKINLISKNDADLLFEKHIFDSLAFNLFYEKYFKQLNSDIKEKSLLQAQNTPDCRKKEENTITGSNVNLLDIGTGGGFPSLPISILYENFNITPLDSINKKINFIKYASSKLELKNINPLCSRVEDLAPSYKNNYDIVVSRAMADLRIILEYALPFLKTGGYFIAYKAIKAEEEINNAQNALEVLNAKIVDIINYTLPIKEENTRKLIVIKKIKETPSIYPRQNGIIKKKPL